MVSCHVGNEGISLKLFGGGDDGDFYWEQAKNVAAGRPATLTSVYPVILGHLIQLIGIEDVYIIRIFNFCGLLLLIASSYQLLKVINDVSMESIDSNASYYGRTILLVCFLLYPSLHMNVSLSIYRDIWIYVLFLMSITVSTRIIFGRQKRFIAHALLLLLLWALALFRKYAVLSFLAGVALYCFHQKLKRPLVTLGIVIFALGFYYTFLIDYEVPLVRMSLRDVLNYRLSFIDIYPGGSQMWIRLDQPSFVGFLASYIYSYVGNLLGPLPWQIRGWNTLFVFFGETIPMCGVIYYLWRNRFALSKAQEYVLLQVFTWIGLIAISNDNLGTATRLRVVGWIPLLIVNVSVLCLRKRGHGSNYLK